MESDAESLQPEGNCLGVALLDTWRLAGLERPELRLAPLSTVKEAVEALCKVRRPQLLIRPGAIFPERALQRFKARRLHLDTITFDRLKKTATLLCMRSMRQLYGIPYPHGHWVVIHEEKVHDQLLPQIEQSFPAMTYPLADKVLAALGATFVI